MQSVFGAVVVVIVVMTIIVHAYTSSRLYKLQRNQIIDAKRTYLTDRYGGKIVKFVDRNKDDFASYDVRVTRIRHLGRIFVLYVFLFASTVVVVISPIDTSKGFTLSLYLVVVVVVGVIGFVLVTISDAVTIRDEKKRLPKSATIYEFPKMPNHEDKA